MCKARHIFIIFSVLMCQATSSLAQQFPQLNHYVFNKNIINPAFTGEAPETNISFIHRNQYLGYTSTFEGKNNIQSQFLNIQHNLNIGNIAVGITAIDDKAGPESNIQFRANASKKIELGNGYLSAGTSIGIINRQINSTILNPRQPNDPNLLALGQSKTKPDIGFGINYVHKNYFIGLSGNHITQPKYFNNSESNSGYKQNRTFEGMVGANLDLNNTFQIKPTILVRKEQQIITHETVVIVENYTNYWVGAGYRSQDAFTVLAGTYLLKNKNAKIGANFELTSNNTEIKAPNSFEVYLSYTLTKNPKNKTKAPIIRSPRYRY
jgi:type IX secretion system PorP/SprF family membrane protein